MITVIYKYYTTTRIKTLLQILQHYSYYTDCSTITNIVTLPHV